MLLAIEYITTQLNEIQSLGFFPTAYLGVIPTLQYNPEGGEYPVVCVRELRFPAQGCCDDGASQEDR